MDNSKIIIPVFFGCLGSLIICTLMSAPSAGNFHGSGAEEQGILDITATVSATESEEMSKMQFFTHAKSERRDIIRERYRDTELQEQVIDYFAEICGSREIASVILVNADMYNISPALALALAWEESRFKPFAVNAKNRDGSIDRGLFQLNNQSFPRLEAQAFFDLEINAMYGMSHLKYCLDTGGSEVAGLAMYNAGTGRVRGTGTPKVTLDYTSRILENRHAIEDSFREREPIYQEQLMNSAEIAEAKPARPRFFVPLMPLAGK